MSDLESDNPARRDFMRLALSAIPAAAVLQAAIDGQGVALARSIMARDDVAAGRLVRLFPEIELASALAYYVVYRPECAALPKLIAFRDWLVREAELPEPY